MTEPREIEAKFDIDPADRALLLSTTTIGRFSVKERRTAAQDDIYFDTDDGLLAAAGSTLRVRRTSGGAKMTYKGRREASRDGEGHIASRPEDEAQLDASQAAAIAIDLPLPELDSLSPLARARGIAGRAALLPVARLQNTRATMLLADDQGMTLELAVDDCVGTRLSDGRATPFDEVELETKTATRAALIETADALRSLVPSLRPSPTTKLGRTLGYGDSGPEGRSDASSRGRRGGCARHS
ncbi:MAG: CYTH domain-containing protein [Thermomicrobiales bacterium]